jgi:acyl transferase domain-containing protein
MNRCISVVVLDGTITIHLGVNTRNMVSRLASHQACVFITSGRDEMILKGPGNLPGKACGS